MLWGSMREGPSEREKNLYNRAEGKHVRKTNGAEAHRKRAGKEKRINPLRQTGRSSPRSREQERVAK